MRLLPACLLLLALCAPRADAASYPVSACFGGENGAWVASTPSAYVGAAVSCPAAVSDAVGRVSGEGLVVHSTPGRGTAPVGVSGALVLEAPPGLAIGAVEFDARVSRNQGWQAGVMDGERWLWCGSACTTSAGAWLHVARSGLASRRLSVLVRCVALRCRRGAAGWAAWVGLRNVRVQLEDPAPPVLGELRGLPAGWGHGRLAVGMDAVDASGIGTVRMEVDGRVVRDEGQRCDFTRVVPCGPFSGAVGADTRDWGDGAHRLRIGVADAAGSWSWRESVVRVDNTAPGEPSVAVEGGGAGWSPAAARVLRRWTRSAGGARVAGARADVPRRGVPRIAGRRGCGVGGGRPRVRRAGRVHGARRARGRRGQRRTVLAARRRSGSTTPRRARPTSSAADGWLRGPVLPLRAAAGVSGLRGFRVLLGASSREVGTSLPLGGLPEGATPIEVRAVSGAGVPSTAVRTVLRIDRSAPAVAVSGAPDR